MSSSPSRGISTPSGTAIKWGGKVILEDIVSKNHISGMEMKDAVVNVAEIIKREDPRIVEARIQGALAHPSSKDPTDTEKVITVGFYSADGTKRLSAHVHENGTYKYWPTRAGKRYE